jgi:hypothetical protein
MQIIKPPMLFDKAKHCNFDISVFESSTDSTDFFRYLYVDIYDDYFKLEDDVYKIKRVIPFLPKSKANQAFNKIKKSDIIRIFIAGESVAEFFPEGIFKKTLKQEIPYENFEIINAGTGSYESYRIKRIVKEILKHQPDYIVIMVGNNDGICEPVVINYLPYKYKIFRTSYVLNRLSNWFVKRYFFDRKSGFSFFQKNVISIIKYAKNKSKIIFVTLPRNSIYVGREFERNYPEIDDYSTDSQKQYYEQRRIFLRSLPNQYSWVSVADYDFVLKESIGDYLGYNVFSDQEHYWLNMYDLISKLIVEQIIKKHIKIDTEYIFDLMKENDSEMQKNLIANPPKDDNLLECRNYSKYYYICEKLYINDKNQFKYFIEKAFHDNNKFIICVGIHLLILSGQEKQALQYLDMFLRKNPENYKGYLLEALAYYKLANRQLSEQYFDTAKRLNPKNNFDLTYLDSFYQRVNIKTNIKKTV